MQVERVPLGHVDHVDPDLGSLDSIFNSKIKPLEVTRSVRIRPQKHIIAVELLTLDDSVEIPALKISIEWQKAVLLIKGCGLIDLLALRIHACLLHLTGLLLRVTLPKYLIQQPVVVILAADVVLRKVELVAARPVVQVLVRVGLVHLVRVTEAFLLVDQHVREGTEGVARNSAKVVDVHAMANEVEIERDRRVARFDLGLPPELHVRHHALARLNQGQRRVLYIGTRLDDDLLVDCGRRKINFLLGL